LEIKDFDGRTSGGSLEIGRRTQHRTWVRHWLQWQRIKEYSLLLSNPYLRITVSVAEGWEPLLQEYLFEHIA
jgi:hypothetical protein